MKINLKLSRIEWLSIIVVIICFIYLRSLNFDKFYSFVNDQSILTMKAMQMWQTKKFSLIGPLIGLGQGGKNLILPSTTYYIILFFTYLGGGNPLIGNYILMILGGLLLPFLYIGVRYFTNKNSAILLCLFYALTPYYIFYTRDNFNPNFFLIFTPPFIFLLALASSKYLKYGWIFVGIYLGFLTQLHVQAGLIYIFLPIYFLIKKYPFRNWIYLITGLFFGLSPFFAIEFKNSFYNFKTFFYSITHGASKSSNSTNLGSVTYIYTGVSILFFTILLSYIKKWISPKIIIIIAVLLFWKSWTIFSPTPSSPQGISHPWFFVDDQKTAQIILNENIKNYNVTLPFHQNTAEGIKFFLIQKNILKDWTDYYNNDYLFIGSKDNNFDQYSTYEINDFKPRKLIKEWKINENYNLYLLQKTSK